MLSIDKKLYYCIFVDHYTKYTWLYTIKNKNEIASIFANFHALVEKNFKHKIVSLYTDGGGEFTGLKQYLQCHGIEHLIFPPYAPQWNSHIVKTARILLNEASLPSELWSFACHNAIYLINRLLIPGLNNERRHSHIVKTARTLLNEAALQSEFCSFACHHAIYLINRLLTPGLNNDSPYKKLFGKPPKYSSLKIFGCLCYPWLKPYTQNKFQPCV